VQFVQAAAAEDRDKHCIQNGPDTRENPRTEWIPRMNRKYAHHSLWSLNHIPPSESSFIAADMHAGI
jgi:hypothetical protein